MTNHRIHPTALIDSHACIAPNVSIGPNCVIGRHVEIDEGSFLGSHIVIQGDVRIGKNNTIQAFTSIGSPPQHKKFEGGDSKVIIGNDNLIREFCTINGGSHISEDHTTYIGNNNWLLSYVHIAHDCVVGNSNVFTNSVQIAGHVHIGDFVTIGGLVGVHPFVNIGSYAMIGSLSKCNKDVLPFCLVDGHPARLRSINSSALERNNFSEKQIDALRRAYRKLFIESRFIFEERWQSFNTYIDQCEPEAKHWLEVFAKAIQQAKNGRYGLPIYNNRAEHKTR